MSLYAITNDNVVVSESRVKLIEDFLDLMTDERCNNFRESLKYIVFFLQHEVDCYVKWINENNIDISKVARLSGLATHPEYRGIGLCSFLVNEIFKRLKKLNFTHVCIGTTSNYSRKIVEKNGCKYKLLSIVDYATHAPEITNHQGFCVFVVEL